MHKLGGSGRASPDAHLSDDETVAKMGHPNMGHPPIHQEGRARIGKSAGSGDESGRPVTEVSYGADGDGGAGR